MARFATVTRPGQGSNQFVVRALLQASKFVSPVLWQLAPFQRFLPQSVTAPSAALETSLAYFARTPRSYLGAGGVQV